MANIPSINQTSNLYSRLKRRNPAHLEKTEESVDEINPESKDTERRRIKDRRRKNIRVLLNRRKLKDRRRTLQNRHSNADQEATARKGSKINTTA